MPHTKTILYTIPRGRFVELVVASLARGSRDEIPLYIIWSPKEKLVDVLASSMLGKKILISVVRTL